MASQSLYRKWRSQTFSDLIGQEAVVRTLLNAVREGRLAHAYLFCGPRGTGKTSVARLLAKAVNCQNPQNGEPCNECVSCQEITAGRSPDVIEIDAASNTGVDNIRDIRENANLLGSGGHHKVYVVDEVHMLSTAAFNALLKTLEEPPPHVIFVLATTEAHKVLPTVVSRCQRFDFRRITMRDIVARLKHVAQGEGLELEPAAADLIARVAQGGMRDALSLLDQAVAFCGQRVDLERTRLMLGLADSTAIRRLIECVADDRAADGLGLINALVNTGADLRQMNSQLSEEWRALMLARAGADLTEVMDRTDEEAHDLATLADRFSLDELMASARIFSRNEGPARGLPLPQLALELSFLECVSVRRGGAVATAPSYAAAAAPAQQPVASQRREAPPAAAQPDRPATTSIAAQTPPSAPVEELDLAAIDEGTWAGPAVPPAPAPASEPAAPREPEPPTWDDSASDVEEMPPVRSTSPASGVDQDWLTKARDQWPLIRKVCKQKGGIGSTVYGLLNDAEPARAEAGEPPVLVMVARHDFHLQKLREPARREVVEWALEQVFNRPFVVRFVGPNEAQLGVATRKPPAGGASRSEPPATPVQQQRRGPAPQSQPAQERDGRSGGSGSAPAGPRNVAPPPPAAPGHSRERLPASPPPPQEEHVSGRTTELERAVLEDPVVQELLRGGLEVAEVRPLNTSEADGYERER